jgi:hypothetical protein
LVKGADTMANHTRKKKNLLIFLLFLFIGIVIQVLLLQLLNWYRYSETVYILNPYADTIFAPTFNEKSFSEITSGMTKSDVETILGKPLYFDENSNCDVYSTDGKLWPHADFAFFSYKVCYQSNRVMYKTTHLFGN